MTSFLSKRLFIALALLLGALLGLTTASANSLLITQQQELKRKKVKRVKRPTFTERDSSGIYFSNVFEQAIQGERPSATEMVQNDRSESESTSGPPKSNTDFVWSDFISGDVIETEIKRLEKSLKQQVTSPGKYKTGYKDARYSFQMLSMLFGIIIEHDDDVRWKRAANLAQPSFAMAAKNARRGDNDSFNYSVARRDDLTELIRGGNMSSSEKPVEQIVWEDAVARSPLMQRIQDSVDKVKPMLSDKNEFQSNQEEILHEANLLAAISEVLIKESMRDADDEDYIQFSKDMSDAARLMMTNTLSNNYDAVSAGFNQVNQSCSDCHDSFR